MQEHEREQPVDLRLVGHQLGQRAAQPQRLGRGLAAVAVGLVEDQVDDGEHGGQPVGQQVVGRHPEGDPGRLDLALGAHQPLRHRRLGDEEGARDLGRGEAPERAQGERDLRLGGERWVAAGEDKLEPLVGEGRLVHVELHGPGGSSSRVLAASVRSRRMRSIARLRAVASSQRARVGGNAVARPPGGGDRERVLGGLLGEVEVAEEADQRGQHAAPVIPERLLEDRYHSVIGRTSTAPPMRAAGMRPATSIAASRSSASNSR